MRAALWGSSCSQAIPRDEVFIKKLWQRGNPIVAPEGQCRISSVMLHSAHSSPLSTETLARSHSALALVLQLNCLERRKHCA